MKSLLKYAGGKGWLLDKYAHLLPDPSEVRAYREPFLGSGAVAQRYLGKVLCVLSDANTRLMAMYRGVRDEPGMVIAVLKTLKYDKGMYYNVRDVFNVCRDAADTSVAAWFIYLNKACFNGLFRENQDGEFNVPFGKFKNPLICDEEAIRAWSASLNAGVHLYRSGYREMLAQVRERDYGFFDPPYVPLSKTANFTEYQAGGFGAEDQAHLAAELHRIDAVGARFTLTNADTPETRALYAPWPTLSVVVPRSIAAKKESREPKRELVVGNRPFPPLAAWPDQKVAAKVEVVR